MHPVLCRIGVFELRSYGVLLVVGVGAGLLVALAEARRTGVPGRTALDCFLVMSVASVLGWLVHGVPIRVLQGGLGIGPALQSATHHDGAIAPVAILFALSAAAIYRRLTGAPVSLLGDAMALGFCISFVVLRWGCFLAGCCYGRETTSPLALYAPDVQGLWAWRYPTQLLESAYCAALFAVLLWARKRKRYDGHLLDLILVLYFAGRFVESYWRGDNLLLLGSVSEIQVYSVILVSIAVLRMRFHLAATRAERRPASVLAQRGTT